jgi:PAS domain S-box-containing protein
MAEPEGEQRLLQAVALQNASAILAARQRAEQDLRRAKEELEARTLELAHSLAMMRATLESTTDGILVTGELGAVTDFNERYLVMWGLSPDLVIARRHREIVDRVGPQLADRASFRAGIEAIDLTSPTETFDVLELADGRVFERHSRIQVLDGRDVGRVWSFRDVTEKRRADETLRDETRILELLNQTGALLASQLDLRTVVQAVTDAATALSGAKFGAFFYNVVGNDGEAYMLYTLSGARREDFELFGQPRATPLFAPTFRGEGPIRCVDVLADPRYGKTPPHHGMPAGHLAVRSYLAVPVVARSGEVIGGLFFGHPEPGVFTERSERIVAGVAAQAASAIDNARLYEGAQRAAEERRELLESERAARSQAERASAMKDEFLATLSHELRTPLNAILGWSQMLRLPTMNPADLRRGLETIERNARAQTQLIEDLLDMSRIASGKLHMNVQSMMPAVVVEAALETVRAAAEAKGIRLTSALDPAAGPIAADPNRLQQVVWNLLSNAIKFTEKRGRVTVRLQRAGSHVEICVDDTGIGIAPEFLPHVFDRFRQADASSTRTVGGLGLGLAIAKQLVELLGGSVRAASPGPGEGATFIVELPLMAVHFDPASVRGASDHHGAESQGLGRVDLSGVSVLVVDDEPDARDLVARVLVECGALVMTAGSAREALAAIERTRPHVLVSDVGMPNIDGYQLLRMVRELGLARGGGVPAIALTAFARSEDRTRALRAGFLVHVTKPVEPAELVATVASVAGRTGEPVAE